MCHTSVAIYVLLYQLVINIEQGGCLKRGKYCLQVSGNMKKNSDLKRLFKNGIRKSFIEIR
jgi:hypothetical protein